jgi:predicted RNA polymerase sigma factor
VTDPAVEAALADAHRAEWGRVLAATARVARDLELAEECVQEAYAVALRAWAAGGIPDNPAAWLTTAAKRRAIDVIRRDSSLRARLPLLVEVEPEADPEAETADGDAGRREWREPADDGLRLIFTCCHPARSTEAQVALTLRLVCGMATPDIARAFLVTETTMAARITRAKKKIAVAHIPYRVPRPAELPERLRADLMPGETEVRGLHALLLVTDARRATRADDQGWLIRLADQDRARWDYAALAEAANLVSGCLLEARPGRYVLQVAIASVYAEAPSYAETDWPQLVALYDELLRVWPSPVVALNRAVPLGMAAGPEAALAAVERLERDGRLAGYQYLPAVTADLLTRLGRTDEAATAYRQALDLTANEAERAFLADRLASAQRVT